MQNAIKTGLFVIPAQAGIQNSLLYLVLETWTPAFSGATNRFASRCWRLVLAFLVSPSFASFGAPGQAWLIL
jgi:hypothetical protein